jgi:Spy/CpxP family protein refolding chaperone
MKLKQAIAGVTISVALAGLAIAQPYGMGLGMMGGYGMGPGMMGGHANDAYAGLDLTAAQQKTIAGIQEQASKSMWQLMGTMHGQGYHMQGMFGPGPLDEVAAQKAFQSMADSQKAMFEQQLDARKKIDAVLTKEQRDKLSRSWGRR